MSKFNSTVVGKTKTVNKAGGEAHVQSEIYEFIAIALTSFLKD